MIWLTTGMLFLAGLFLSFFFSGMETGLFALNRLRIRNAARKGDRRAAALQRHLEDPETFLWTILVGNTAANFMIVISLILVLRPWFTAHPWLSALVLVTALMVLFVCCDLLSKLLYRRYANQLTSMSLPPYRIFHWVFAPIVFLASGVADLLLRFSGGAMWTGRLFSNREEMRRMMQTTSQDLSPVERSMIERVMDLQQRTLGQVMIPLSKVVSVPSTATLEDALNVARETTLLRLPVLAQEGKRQVLIGMLNLKPLLYGAINPKDPVTQHLSGIIHLPTTLALDEALESMQQGGHRVAVALNAQHQEVGWIHIKDILKTVFGEVNL